MAQNDHGWPLLPHDGPDDCAAGSAAHQPASPYSMLLCDLNGPGSPTMISKIALLLPSRNSLRHPPACSGVTSMTQAPLRRP
eukprot:scaffold67395_cov28-Attheya_sp.AAC.1